MSIPVERYVDPRSLEEELEKIFWRRCFVAHESDVAAPNDYFSFRLGRRNLTLRRFGPELALLDNVCRHRFNLIDPPGFGNRPFRCGYHGWTYGRSGEISFIPFPEDFDREPEPLVRHNHETENGFVFKSDPRGEGVLPGGELLSSIGTPVGDSFHRGSLLHSCNWKLMVENVLEGYHLSIVHPNTFGKSGFTSSSRADEVNRDADSLLTTYPNERFATHLALTFPAIVPGYRHLFVFPNLFVSVTNDLVYFVSNLLPIAEDKTILHFRLFATPTLENVKPALQDHLKEEAVKFTAAALNEDKEVLERCQLGIASASGNYVLGTREQRIKQFHDSYMRQL
jgi:phenylpropionate dioxygenase-like ring-hydroxylating dioxygenase large terminal subunit